MSDQTPPRTGVRQGLKLLLIAGCLTPLIFLLEGILPSHENTIIDEMPQLVLTVSLLGLALTGVARITYSLLTERRPSHISPPENRGLGESIVSTSGASALPLAKQGHIDRVVTPVHTTPSSGR